MNKTNILKWMVGLLVLCNIGLIVTLWLKPGATGPERHETPRDYVIRNLDFTEGQVDAYDVLIHAHRQAMNDLREEAMQYRRMLFSSLAKPGAHVNADSISQLIAGTQKRIEIVTYEHFADVRKICSEQQKPVFDQIINNVIKKMNGGMRPPPPDELHGRPDGLDDGPRPEGHRPPRGGDERP